MKIGTLIPQFPSQTHSFFWREIVALRRDHQIDVAIVSTQRPARPIPHEWVEEAEVQYLFPLSPVETAVLCVKLLSWLPKLLADSAARACLSAPRNWAFALMAFKLSRICKAKGVDHLHVHSCNNSALIAAFCNLATQLPYSLHLHGPLKDYGPYQKLKWQHAAFVFVITEKLRQETASALPNVNDDITVVPMGVDTDQFSPPRRPRPAAPVQFRWFCCARLNFVKGHDTLIAAAARLKRDRPDIDFVIHIAGEDEPDGNGYRRDVEREIEANDLNGTVRLLGAVPQAKVLDELHASDGFVLASRHEPLGVAYMEAMACALPTIGTRAGGVEELMEHDVNSLLVPPNDPEMLAQTMLKVMSNADLRARLGNAARQTVVDHFRASRSADAIAERLRALGHHETT